MNYPKIIAHIFRQIKGRYLELNHPEIPNPYASVNINNPRNVKLIEKFLNKLSDKYGIESIGKNFLFDYIAYQICCYLSSESFAQMQLNWVLGDKAWQRWLNKTEHYKYWYRENLVKNNVDIEYIEKVIKNKYIENKPRSLVSYQDSIRKQKKNTIDGLVFCTTNGVFYTKKSNECTTCNNVKLCKLLKKNDKNKIV